MLFSVAHATVAAYHYTPFTKSFKTILTCHNNTTTQLRNSKNQTTTVADMYTHLHTGLISGLPAPADAEAPQPVTLQVLAAGGGRWEERSVSLFVFGSVREQQAFQSELELELELAEIRSVSVSVSVSGDDEAEAAASSGREVWADWDWGSGLAGVPSSQVPYRAVPLHHHTNLTSAAHLLPSYLATPYHPRLTLLPILLQHTLYTRWTERRRAGRGSHFSTWPLLPFSWGAVLLFSTL